MKKKKYDVIIIGSVPKILGSKKEGGVAQVVWQLAQSYKDKQFSFCVGARGKYYKTFQSNKGIDIYGINFSVWVFIRTLITLLKNTKHLNGRFRDNVDLFLALYLLISFSSRLEFKCIHVHHVTNRIPLAAKILGLKQNIIATIHSYHSVIMAIEKNRIIEINKINKELKCIDHIVHVSETVKEQGLELGIQWEVPHDVIYNGIKHNDPIVKRKKDDKRKEACFVGGFILRKGIPKLLKAFSSDKIELDKITWIGDGHLKSKIHDLTNIESKLLGNVSNEEVLRIMADKDLMVVPSISESFGLVYIEALSTGTPVIGFHKVINEFIQKLNLTVDEEKFLIPYDYENESTEHLIKKINFGVNLKENYPEASEKLPTKIKNTFAWSAIAMEYVRLYDFYISN